MQYDKTYAVSTHIVWIKIVSMTLFLNRRTTDEEESLNPDLQNFLNTTKDMGIDTKFTLEIFNLREDTHMGKGFKGMECQANGKHYGTSSEDARIWKLLSKSHLLRLTALLAAVG